MIRSARVAHGQGRHTEIFERLHPGFENRRDRFILLKVDAANLARPVVHVEVGGNLRLLRLDADRTSLTAQQRGHPFHEGIVHRRTRAEVLLHIVLRSQQALLFPAPQPDANGAPRLDIERLQYTNGFHHHDRSSAIVGRARARVPRIQMRAEHHNFVFSVIVSYCVASSS